jgi:hypothetical protein
VIDTTAYWVLAIALTALGIAMIAAAILAAGHEHRQEDK